MGRCWAWQQICRNMTEKPFTGPNSILPIKHKNWRVPRQPYNEETVFLVVGISQILLWEGNRQVFSVHLHNGRRWPGNILRKLLFQSQRASVGRRLVIQLDWIYDSPESSTTLSISSSSNIIIVNINIEQHHHRAMFEKQRASSDAARLNLWQGCHLVENHLLEIRNSPPVQHQHRRYHINTTKTWSSRSHS